ncbi:E3 ubiquitin-protein ligase RNF167-like [Paroedura picta]|uniref:E3 ubiquitin-protein ligase RNF167-like n=1 Tax=Paroedura picta TaxID=143630 RepID=UPI004056C137
MWALLPLPHVVMMFLVFQVPAGKGFIRAICRQNASSRDFRALPALFGPPVPAEGLVGHLVEVRPENACHPIKSPPNTSAVFIALIRRYDCSLATKLLHAQRAGYQAAIVHSQGLMSMVREAEAWKKIHIPSMITTSRASRILKFLHRSGKLSSVVLVPGHLHLGSAGNPHVVRTTTLACRCHIRLPGPHLPVATLHILWMIPASALIASLLIEKYLLMCKKWKMVRNQSYREKGNEQAGFSLLGSKYQECAICLEKYLEYDSLKVLSCSHAFHSRCIDRWHITQARSKTCPLCMQKVMLVVRLQTVRLWKEEAKGHGKNRRAWPGKAKPSFDQ